MQQVGIRELREQASQILRRVREDGEAFEVTYHGRVVARIVPTLQVERELTVEEWLEGWDRLAEEISAVWPPGVSAVEAVREQRREL